jgi:hypothetical protein
MSRDRFDEMKNEIQSSIPSATTKSFFEVETRIATMEYCLKKMEQIYDLKVN